jgi:hypothetical protein
VVQRLVLLAHVARFELGSHRPTSVPMADSALDASEKGALPLVSVAGVHCALTFAHPPSKISSN